MTQHHHTYKILIPSTVQFIFNLIRYKTRRCGRTQPRLYNFYSDHVTRVHESRNSIKVGVSRLSIQNIFQTKQLTVHNNKMFLIESVMMRNVAIQITGGFFCWSLEELRESMEILGQVFIEFGLNLNLYKTETMIFNWQRASYEEIYPQAILSLNGFNIKNTTAFKYLGVWINHLNLHVGTEELITE